MADQETLRFALKDFQPATFPERGAHAPFTSPLLLHARLRISPTGARELVIRNPGGGEGWYVGAWGGMVDTARITVHDRLLYRRIEAAHAVAPVEVRRVARSVALEGYAGRIAQDAARAAAASEERDRREAFARLLLVLAPAAAAPIAGARSQADLAALAPSLLASLGTAPAGELAGRLDALAVELAPAGIAPDAPGLLARDLAGVRGLAAELEAAALADPHLDTWAVGAVRQAARAAIRLAGQAQQVVQEALADPAAVLAGWPGTLAPLAAQQGRMAWLLDGFPALIATWRAGRDKGTQATRQALAELADHLPPLPREITGGQVRTPARDARGAPRRAVAAGEDWLAGIAERDLVARNEALLARAM
jgi:hypothetical protein